ncbi:MAG: ribosome hibernation-promoting factor, HPF/YfiA family [Pyrinomonadaceae bacterium]
MKIEYTGRHVEVTPALKAHVAEHFRKLDHLFDGKAIKAHVIMDVERNRHRSEIIVYWRNEVITATTTLADMYRSLTQTIGKIEKQALKLKNKVIDKSHRARKVGEVTASTASVEPAPQRPRIIVERRQPAKPMSPEEAAMLLSDKLPFVVFRNTDSQGSVSVIYKRRDGNFGLIQPR